MKYFMILMILFGLVMSNAFAESSDFTVAELTWKEASFPSHEGTKAIVIVTDHDMNKQPKAIDYIWITIHSDSDRTGFRMNLFETDFDSGLFKGEIIFVDTSPSGRGFLHTVDGDTITAKYVDKIFPANYTSNLGNIIVGEKEIEMYATALVGSTGPPLERVPASNFSLLDVENQPIADYTVSVDQQIQLISDLENQRNYTQPFAYLVMIQNEQGQGESLSWITGNLTSFQKISSGVTWIPFEEGKYTATAFVWESITNPTALSPPISMDFTVSFEKPHLIDKPKSIPLDIASVEDKYIHLNPTDTCATISLRLLTSDKLEQIKSRDKEVMFFEINEKDLKDMPILDELIRATHHLQSHANDSAHTEMGLRELVDYEFFIMAKSIEKYNDSQDDYFLKLDSDLDKRLADPSEQGFSNEFIAPQIIYHDKIYVIGHTVFWISNEHEMQSLSVHLQENIRGDEKFITLTDKDMTQIPKIKQAIEKIGTELESTVAFKGLSENPDWNEYKEWFEQKKTGQFNLDETYVPGFVYKDEYYDLGFLIC